MGETVYHGSLGVNQATAHRGHQPHQKNHCRDRTATSPPTGPTNPGNNPPHRQQEPRLLGTQGERADSRESTDSHRP